MKVEPLYKNLATCYASNLKAWRKWLLTHHDHAKSVWLIIYHKDSHVPSVKYPEAVDEALCFGWIDSKPNKRDHESYYQFFTPRKAKSNWSRVNKEKVSRLRSTNRLQPAGIEMIRLAKETGTWDALNDVDNLIIPSDLSRELASYPNAAMHFEAFPPSVKRGILEWIFNAKRPATRGKRIAETARLANDNIRANQYRPQD